VIPGVAYTHPEVAWVGVGEDEAKKAGRKVERRQVPLGGLRPRDRQRRRLRLHQAGLRRETHRVIGGSIVGPNAGDMIGEVCLAIEMGADAVDIGKTIHPHPTLGETIGMAAEVAHGSCTDLPPMRKK
jgi:dihydrolipoamide dehydrogenase